jgi:hypothetical protein
VCEDRDDDDDVDDRDDVGDYDDDDDDDNNVDDFEGSSSPSFYLTSIIYPPIDLQDYLQRMV